MVKASHSSFCKGKVYCICNQNFIMI
jgi:hypothetical protein